MGAAAVPLMIAQAGIGLYQADQSNRANRRAAGVELEQLSDSASLERRKRANESQLIRSRLRVLQAESGLGFEGSFSDLERQTDIDEQVNLAIIDRNLYNARRRTVSQLAASYQNPLLAAFSGGLGGYATGLQIDSASSALESQREMERLRREGLPQ